MKVDTGFSAGGYGASEHCAPNDAEMKKRVEVAWPEPRSAIKDKWQRIAVLSRRYAEQGGTEK